MSKLVDKTDLTRWNRAGLTRFRYVDGNAITYLETLRQAMRAAFDAGGGATSWTALDTAIPVPPVESDTERQSRWTQQYHAERRDYGWEILRTYARSTHVLTEHLDAYANEGYLRTATQWSSVRRLVEMLDYHPAPPASASAPIALLAKNGQSGTVKAGFAVKNQPQDGSNPVVFETLEDLDVDPALNALLARQWNESQEPFRFNQAHNFPLNNSGAAISDGAQGVLVVGAAAETAGDESGIAATVTDVRQGTDPALSVSTGTAPPGFPSHAKHYQVRLLLGPKFKRAPKLSGNNVIVLTPTGSGGHGLTAGAVIAWESTSGDWSALRVVQVDGNIVQLDGGALPDDGASIYLTMHANPGPSEVGSVVVLPPSRFTDDVWSANLSPLGEGVIQPKTVKNESGTDVPLYDYVSGHHTPLHYLPAGSDPVATVVRARPQTLEFDGNPDKLVTGDWVLAEDSDGRHAARITQISESENSFTLYLSRTFDTVQTLYANFATTLRPRDYDVNAEPVFLTAPAARSASHSTLPLVLTEIPDLLRPGRALIVAGRKEAMSVTVTAVDPETGHVTVSPAIPGSEPGGSGTNANYTRFDTRVYGNVVQAGHGETQSERVLTSGDATQSGQTATFDTEGVSFVTASDFPTGVRAAVTVRVGERTWQQVSTLNDSAPEAPDYVVRMNEDGTLQLQFGDGHRGRRLPTGENNVRITARVGSGLSGNLDALSLVKPVKPHYLLDGVVQPLATKGGNDMETVDSMRDNAPAAVLTLERAVSLEDYTHLAASNSSVWQARAFRVPPGIGRNEHIKVAVVPAGGGELGTLQTTLEQYLGQHAPPGVKTSVVAFGSIILDLTVTLGVNTKQYDPDLVTQNVRDALLRAFALRIAPLGEPLFRSRVYQVIESVEGVANSQCRINPDGFHNTQGHSVVPKPHLVKGAGDHVKRVTPAPDQVIYADADLSRLTITAHAYNG